MKACVVGATGATGQDLVELLIHDKTFERVDVFVRRPLEGKHEKVQVHVIDFDQPEQWQGLVTGDVLFSCLGTTLKVAGSKEAQWKIDYTYQHEFAKAARANGIRHYVLVSAVGASTKSLIFYSRMKGQLEEAVRMLGFERLTIVQPPILVRKGSDRLGEKIGVSVIRWLARIGLPVTPPLKTEELAQQMVDAVKVEEPE